MSAVEYVSSDFGRQLAARTENSVSQVLLHCTDDSQREEYDWLAVLVRGRPDGGLDGVRLRIIVRDCSG